MQFVSKYLHLKYFFAIFLLSLLLSAAYPSVPDKTLRAKTVKNIAIDDISGEDLGIRRAAIEALGNRAGTIVIMSPKTGRIYSIVNQNWAIRKGFKPCSTIKLVTAVGGYNENLIRSNGKLAHGSFRLGLDDSLSYSNNTYFQKVGAYLGNKKMIRYARMLGLGERTGINAPGEFQGRLPFANDNLRIYSHADDFEVTPLQLAVMVSAITNGGDLVIPQITRTKYQKSNFKGFYRRELDLSPNIFERVIPGMIGAVKYGTAKHINNPNLNIAGKTGSCIARGTWVGLFVSVAPILNPRFTVIVITEGKYARGKYAAKIAGKIYQALSPRFNDKFEGELARKITPLDSNDSKNISKKIPSVAEKNNPIRGKSISTTVRKIPEKIPSAAQKKRGNKASGATNQKAKYSPTEKVVKTKELFPTIIIRVKAEITRPRVVKNR